MKIRTKLITAFSIPFLIINGISASLISMQTTGRMQAQEIRNIEHAFSFIERELAFYDDSLSTSTDSAATMYMEESAASRNDEIREEWLLNTLKVNLQNIQKKLSVFGAVHVIHSDGTVLYSSVSDPPEDLIKLLNLTEFHEETFRVRQFAIWTITDNPERDGYIGIATSFQVFGTDPSDEEIDKIRNLFIDAGISVSKYKALG